MTTLINLLGGQLAPNLIAIKELTPHKVVALATKDTKKQHRHFRELADTPHLVVTTSPFDARQTFTDTRNFLDQISPEDEVILNLTGGTKLMALGAQAAINQYTGKKKIVYVDSSHGSIVYLSGGDHPMAQESMQTCLSLNEYACMAGEHLVDAPEAALLSGDRLRICKMLLTKSSAPLFNSLKEMFGKNKKPKSEWSKTFRKKNRELQAGWNHNQFWLRSVPQGTLESPENPSFQYIVDAEDGGAFFTGAWLEEWVAHCLKASNELDSVYHSVRFSYSESTERTLSKFKKRLGGNMDKNELDVVVTKGTRAAIIECKSENVYQEHVYKLDTLRRTLLGDFGHAFLVVKFLPSPTIQEKCRDLKIPVIAVNGMEEYRLTDRILQGISRNST